MVKTIPIKEYAKLKNISISHAYALGYRGELKVVKLENSHGCEYVAVVIDG